MKNNNYFEDMEYQLFVLLAEILKLCPDIDYYYDKKSDGNDYLIFYGSKYRDYDRLFQKPIIISVCRPNISYKVTLKELSFFDYRVYQNTKDFYYNSYSIGQDTGSYEKKSENLDYNTVLQLIKDFILKFPIKEELLDDSFKKKIFFLKLKISLKRLGDGEDLVLSHNLDSLFDVNKLSLSELENKTSHLKYCLSKYELESIIYGKVSVNTFKEISNSYYYNSGILKDKDCIKLIEDYYKCEPINCIYYWDRELLIEVKGDK